jgi:hypothetical protein
MFSVRYKDSAEFQNAHEKKFESILSATTKLKSSSQISESGFALVETERLTYEFLNLSAVCSDLLFGLSASVLDAKAKMKQIEGMFFRDLTVKTSAIDKAKLVHCLPQYIEADKNYNDLTDLADYILMKKKDFDSAHYHYRELNNKK